MTLATFYARIADIINYDVEADNEIPNAVRDAARYIEQNYTFKYMERFVCFTLDAGDRLIDMPDKASFQSKSFIFIRIQQDDGSFDYLEKIDPRDVDLIQTAQPKHYWLDGMDHIVFDNIADQDYQVEMSYNRYTLWPTVTTENPALLQQFEAYLLATSIINLAPFVDDSDLLQAYGLLQQQHQRTALLADEEMRRVNEEPEMGFGTSY